MVSHGFAMFGLAQELEQPSALPEAELLRVFLAYRLAEVGGLQRSRST